MDTPTFISNLAASAAWPLTVLGVAMLLRPSLASLLADVKELRFHGLEATFERELATARRIADNADVASDLPSQPTATDDEQLVRLASLSPRAVIIDSWAEVESAARGAITLDPDHRPPTAGVLGDLLAEREVVDDAGLQIYSILRGLRNRVAHEPHYSLDPAEALEYATLARSLVDKLRAEGKGEEQG